MSNPPITASITLLRYTPAIYTVLANVVMSAFLFGKFPFFLHNEYSIRAVFRCLDRAGNGVGGALAVRVCSRYIRIVCLTATAP